MTASALTSDSTSGGVYSCDHCFASCVARTAFTVPAPPRALVGIRLLTGPTQFSQMRVVEL